MQACIIKLKKSLQLQLLRQLLFPHCQAAKEQGAKKSAWQSVSDPTPKLVASAASFCACKKLISPNPNIFKGDFYGLYYK